MIVYENYLAPIISVAPGYNSKRGILKASPVNTSYNSFCADNSFYIDTAFASSNCFSYCHIYDQIYLVLNIAAILYKSLLHS